MNDQKKSSKGTKTFLLVVIFLFFIFSSFVSGFFLGFWKNNLFKPDLSFEALVNQASLYLNKEQGDINLFWKVWEIVKEQSLNQPIDQTKMFYGAISGMVASLNDPYSVFLDPKMSQEFEKELTGKFEGIGAEIGIKNDQLTVVAPLTDSPAEKAGLKAGDQILKINNLETKSMNLDYAVSLIRGEKGTSVTLNILSRDKNQPEDITIKRDEIKVASVSLSFKNNNIAYIKLAQFDNRTKADFNKAVNQILIKNPKGLILDLRNNPGGYLDAAVEVAGEFLENKVIVIEEFSQGNKKEYTSEATAILKDMPLVVLVDQGSASGSEIVAGALQDYQRAKIVGEKTFGKGTVQDLENFNDGSSLKLTVAKWLTPSGHSIEDNGIQPDTVIKITDEDYNQDRDPQLDKALELLSSTK